jgi:hypothetical protein
VKVKDLMQALTQCDPEAEVCTEVNMDHAAHIVKQYDYDKDNKAVYIADDLMYVDDHLAGCFEECSVKFKEEW